MWTRTKHGASLRRTDIRMGELDARKTLTQLKDEWSTCVRCELGTRLQTRQGHYVFGQGYSRSVMFVGEGPGVEEDKEGIPFVGRSGKLLRRILSVLGLKDFYITNIICCRSCEVALDDKGLPMTLKDYRTQQVIGMKYKDVTPTPPQKAACRPRLLEEIYLVDPIVIVGLGAPACSELLGHSVVITRDRGEPAQIAIPGASFRPVLTEKKQQWLRKNSAGEWHSPVEPNEVLYHFIPTLHPAYVLRELADRGPNNAFQKFVADIRSAAHTYEAYVETVFGAPPQHHDALDEAALQEEVESEQ